MWWHHGGNVKMPVRANSYTRKSSSSCIEYTLMHAVNWEQYCVARQHPHWNECTLWYVATSGPTFSSLAMLFRFCHGFSTQRSNTGSSISLTSRQQGHVYPFSLSIFVTFQVSLQKLKDLSGATTRAENGKQGQESNTLKLSDLWLYSELLWLNTNSQDSVLSSSVFTHLGSWHHGKVMLFGSQDHFCVAHWVLLDNHKLY